jgi:transcriptional regulator with XRE-family HTH domain
VSVERCGIAEANVTGAESSALGVFAAELKAQRQRLSWTQVELGDKIGYSGSFISDIERCERTPKLDFAERCDKEMGLPGTFVRVQELTRRDAYPSWFYPVIPFEAKAVRIHAWEPLLVPGLMQTEDYARNLIRVTRPQDSDDAVDRLVSARLERQEILSRDQPPLLWYVLDEGVLHRMVGGPSVMSAQLERLITAASTPGTLIQILTFATGEGIGGDGPISVFEFPDASTVCYTECYRGGRLVEDHAEVAEMMTKVSLIRAAALSRRESLELMRRIRSGINDH